MIELPYGIADFHRIRRQGLVYVDRTAHIHDIERQGSVLVLLRPRRFGTLSCFTRRSFQASSARL